MQFTPLGGDVTTDGFRPTFRGQSIERMQSQNEMPKDALVHVAFGKSGSAYRRVELFQKRRVMMGTRAARHK